MKLVSPKIYMVIIICLGILPLMIDSASAHRVNVFAWVEGDTVYVEGKFPGGRKVKAGKIIVFDPRGVELLSGLTNEQGEYSFKVPKQTDLRIVLSAGQGHQGEWIVRTDELDDLPSQKTEQTGTGTEALSVTPRAGSETSTNMKTVTPDTAISREELETIIESVLDEKLKPINRMLSEIRQEGPTAKDIFAGIGYILGLVGIAAYVHSRKKKV
jgi:nickel transport protein